MKRRFKNSTITFQAKTKDYILLQMIFFRRVVSTILYRRMSTIRRDIDVPLRNFTKQRDLSMLTTLLQIFIVVEEKILFIK